MVIIADTDIDIDVKNRDQALSTLKYVRGMLIDNNGNMKPHNVGVYFQNIPQDPITGLSTITYQDSLQRGYFKIDILNVSLYDGVKNEEHLQRLMDTEPLWEMLDDDFFISQLWQIHDHYELVRLLKPRSVDQLAMILGLIRPAKRHLCDKSWNEIEKEIWIKPKLGDKGYEFVDSFFKKSHAIAYSLGIVVQMNLIVEQLENNQ